MTQATDTDADVPVISSSFQFAWSKTWQHFFSLLGVMIVVSGIPMAITYKLDNWMQSAVIQLYGSFFLGGMWLLFINMAEGSRFRFETLFSKPLQFWKFLVANIVTALIVIVGLILLVVPGVMLYLQFMVVPQVIASEDLGPFAAFKRSAELTKGHRRKLFFWLLTYLGILVVAFLVAGIAVVPFTLMANTFHIDLNEAIRITVTVMMMPLMAFTFLAWSHVYFQLQEAFEEQQAEASHNCAVAPAEEKPDED